LNLKYDEPLSNVPFNFNVCRYTKELGDRCTMTLTLILGRAVQVDPVKPELKPPGA
jgi:hypothetical protein